MSANTLANVANLLDLKDTESTRFVILCNYLRPKSISYILLVFLVQHLCNAIRIECVLECEHCLPGFYYLNPWRCFVFMVILQFVNRGSQMSGFVQVCFCLYGIESHGSYCQLCFDFSLGSYLMAIAELSLKKTELEETRSKAQRESKMLLDYTRKAIARLTYLKRWDSFVSWMYVQGWFLCLCRSWLLTQKLILKH